MRIVSNVQCAKHLPLQLLRNMNYISVMMKSWDYKKKTEETQRGTEEMEWPWSLHWGYWVKPDRPQSLYEGT